MTDKIPPPTPEELKRFERAKTRLSMSIEVFSRSYVHVDRVRKVVADLHRLANSGRPAVGTTPGEAAGVAYEDAAAYVARELLDG